ncbi:hypothetical protein NE686_17295 [Tissierella carlieri]|uniref:Uncharacterized protein n=1 Tax=Tissierella carlieri TaxID=689904 RepID=A0ABT1SEE6_9FIRM|nr:hypothetical protein [Tissierella carlieri]MCQ4924861.1 hypothetical protein [Tissierella carlieri]
MYDLILDKIINTLERLVGEKKIQSYEKKVIERFFLSKIRVKKPFRIYVAFKILVPLFVFFIVFNVSYTNLDLKRESILMDYNFSTNQIEKKTLIGLSESDYKELQEKEKTIMLDIFNEIDDAEYEELNTRDKYQYIQGILQRKYDFSDENNYIYSKRAVEKKLAIEKLRLDRLFIINTTLLSFWLFDLILIGLSKWGKSDIDDELEQLELTTVLIGSTSHISVGDILVGLESNSHFFRPYLEDAKKEYLVNSDDALQTLRRTPYGDFQIIAKTLEQAKNSNLDKAMYNLRKHIERKKKKKEIEGDDKLNKKDLTVHILIMVSVAFLLMMWFYPLTTIISDLN